MTESERNLHDFVAVIEGGANPTATRNRRPQEDVPEEVIIHYIVKDYRRMFNEVDRLRALGKQAAQEVRKVLCRATVISAENDVLKKKNRQLTEENSELRTQVNDLKQRQCENGRDAVKTLERIRQIIDARNYLDKAEEEGDTD